MKSLMLEEMAIEGAKIHVLPFSPFTLVLNSDYWVKDTQAVAVI